MFTRKTRYVWIGILALSGMFLLGQQSWLPTEDPCVTAPPGCVNGTCVTGVGTCDCDFGYEGEICDALIEIEPCEPPSCEPYNPIPAGQFAPTGCETYIGAHPVYPGELLCCSAPTAPAVAPTCLTGVDTPDIPCVVEIEFCDDGSARKAFSPDPLSGYPGHTISTSGSWTLHPHTGELEIITTSSAMDGGMIMVTTETYPSAFTYDNGTKLDLYSPAAVNINEGGIGYYHRSAFHLTDISGLWSATLDAYMDTDVTVTATGYDSTFAQEIDCSPPLGMVCLVTPTSEVVFATGTHTLPIDLYITPAGKKMYQTAEAAALVFERQPDPLCDGIECGEHGYCRYGACICRDGYIGEFCDEPGPCVGMDCGAHGTCVEGLCACDAGYEGESCEVDSNECDPNPCLNGGSCAEGVPGTYECTCIDGFTGNNCENCPTDADGDGYGDPATVLCPHPESDCDDNHATVYPGAPELCDGLDNQCAGDPGYGSIDEGYTFCGAMVPVPAGCFDMGDAFAEGWPDELPAHNVCMSSFEMDIHEITNAEYAECVADGGCTAPSSSSSYSRGTYYGDPAYNDYPVIWMKWDQVVDYCAWAGKRLPTEAEWEYAARGGLAGKRYPWGDTISSTDANYDFNTGDTMPVESYASNGYGLYDMAGNVWEWVADWFNESYYSVSPTEDPTGPASGAVHVRRGGSFDHSTFGLRVANRCDFCHADRHGNNLGGRCAR
jgi:formylglycine-generating enzyme required for sulfatase activity